MRATDTNGLCTVHSHHDPILLSFSLDVSHPSFLFRLTKVNLTSIRIIRIISSSPTTTTKPLLLPRCGNIFQPSVIPHSSDQRATDASIQRTVAQLQLSQARITPSTRSFTTSRYQFFPSLLALQAPPEPPRAQSVIEEQRTPSIPRLTRPYRVESSPSCPQWDRQPGQGLGDIHKPETVPQYHTALRLAPSPARNRDWRQLQ